MHAHRHNCLTKLFWRNCVLAMVLFLSACGASLAQTTWYVATNGADSGRDGQSWPQAFLTISNAYAQASATLEDTIKVSNGVYETSYEIAVAKPVTIIGVYGWTNTVVKGNAGLPSITNRCFNINHTSAVLQGLTITNGGWINNSTLWRGGGIYLQNGTVRDCLITGNSGYQGGGVCMLGGSSWRYSLVSNCLIRANISSNSSSASGGAGINLRAGIIADCQITGNTDLSPQANGGGVAVYEVDGYAWSLSGCSIISNHAYIGGGLYINSVNSQTISNCHIDMNTVPYYGGGIYSVGVITFAGGSVNSNNNTGSYGGGIYAGNNITVTDASISYNMMTNVVSSRGAGIYVAANVSAVLYNCDISYNRLNNRPDSSQQYGSGVFFTGSNLTVQNCRLIGNEIANSNLVWGGGIYSRNNSGSVLIENSSIQSNRISCGRAASSSAGGGLCLSSNAVVRNCLIAGNYASLTNDGGNSFGYGGGIYFAAANCSNLVESCTIVSNYAKTSGPGIYLTDNGQDEVWNCVVHSNYYASGATNWYFGDPARTNRVYFTCTPQPLGGSGNTMRDPQFVDYPAGNYRLKAGSPGVDAGTNRGWMASALDLDGAIRLDKLTGRADMGCYEYRHAGTMFTVR